MILAVLFFYYTGSPALCAVAMFRVSRSLQPPHFACGFVPVAAFGALHSAAAKHVKTNDFVGIYTFKIDDFVGNFYNKTNDFVGIYVFKTNDFVVNSVFKINDFVGGCQNGF